MQAGAVVVGGVPTGTIYRGQIISLHHRVLIEPPSILDLGFTVAKSINDAISPNIYPLLKISTLQSLSSS